MQQQLGFIGLGALGSVLAARLTAAGHAINVWARDPQRVAARLPQGAGWADSPAALGDSCEVVFICITDTAAVHDVVFGEHGLAEAKTPALVVDHSTIHPAATRDIAAALNAANGMRWLDAPVTGGVLAAEAGRLVIMAGGAESDLKQARPLLDSYAERITHMGGQGTGQASKIANQMMIGGNIAIAAEALNFAHNFGVDARLLPDALAGGWADSAVLQNHARRMAAATYPDSVNARLMAKDIDIAADLGKLTESPMPVTALVQQLYRMLIAGGHSDKGQIGLMWLYAQHALISAAGEPPQKD